MCGIVLQSVLESIRDLMNTECVVPGWLHDVFLGYGDPGSAHYTRQVLIHLPDMSVHVLTQVCMYVPAKHDCACIYMSMHVFTC